MPKTLTAEQEKRLDHIGTVSALQGAAIGAGIGLLATVITRQKSTYFRALSKPMQSVFVVSGVASGVLFAVDRAATKFENSELGYADEDMVRELEQGRSPLNRVSMSTTDRWLHYINDHRWSVIGGSWAVSMIGALSYSFSNRYLTTQQKLVQARMYAQAVTIAVLMASAGLAIYVNDEDKNKFYDEPDEQLRRVLELPDKEGKVVKPAATQDKH